MRISYKVDKNGKMYKYDLDSLTRIDDESYDIYQTGEGFLMLLRQLVKKLCQKLSGKTDKEIAKKGATKAVEKSSEAVEAKMGEIVSNKLDSVFIKKPENENKGYKIIEALKSHPLNKKYQQDATKQTNIDDDIMKLEIEKLLQM